MKIKRVSLKAKTGSSDKKYNVTEIYIKYSEDLENTRQELTDLLADTLEIDDNVFINALNLIDDIMEKAAINGFDKGYLSALDYTWKMHNDTDYIRIGIQDYAYIGDED